MEKLLVIIGFFVLLNACSPANQYLRIGNYKAAIETGANKIRKNPKKADKTILAIERAFSIERTRILSRINQLKVDGDPENWIEVHALYKQLNYYQNILKQVLPMYIKKEFRNANIELINIDEDLADTKLKAAEFLYLEAERLLNQPSKIAAREAYNRFKKVKELHGNFKDTDQKIRESFDKGQNHVLIRYSNDSRLIVPKEFMNNLSRYNVRSLNTEWVKFHLSKNDVKNYDYNIDVIIQTIDIGPEQLKETQYEELARVEDGWQYALDGKGNVEKDTLGNDIKEPRFIDVKAIVRKFAQNKAGFLSGFVKYSQVNGQEIGLSRFKKDLVFQNFYAQFQGDKRALSKESQQLLGGRALPFPSDLTMVLDASDLIKDTHLNIIRNNISLVYE